MFLWHKWTANAVEWVHHRHQRTCQEGVEDRIGSHYKEAMGTKEAAVESEANRRSGKGGGGGAVASGGDR